MPGLSSGMIAVIPLLTLLSLLRVRGTGALDTVWAEDGRTFFQQSLHTGPLRLLVTPYNGYLHLVPRLAMDIAGLFPIADLAAVLAVIGALISSGLAAFVYRVSGERLHSRVLQAVVAAPLALTWVAQSEVGNDVANAQWYLIYASFWAALYRGANPRYRVIAAVVIFFAVASDPFTVVYVPLLRKRRAQLFGMVAGLIYQGFGGSVVVAVCVCWGYFGGAETRYRADSPSWRAQLRLAAAYCASSRAADADVTIAPTASWKVRIPCRVLLGSS